VPELTVEVHPGGPVAEVTTAPPRPVGLPLALALPIADVWPQPGPIAADVVHVARVLVVTASDANGIELVVHPHL
jgi:hypothetical protein